MRALAETQHVTEPATERPGILRRGVARMGEAATQYVAVIKTILPSRDDGEYTGPIGVVDMPMDPATETLTD